MWINTATPAAEPGTLPSARATTTLRRTVPFFRCSRPAGILVKKLKTASEPTATMAGTLNPKIRTGRSRTPPPIPVRPMRTPTTNPTRILTAIKGMTRLDLFLLHLGTPSRGLPIYADEALALEVQNDRLRGFLG